MGIIATTKFTGPHTLRLLQNGAEGQGHPCLYSATPQNKRVDLRRASPVLPRHEKRSVASGLGEAGLVQAEASPGLCCIRGLLLGSGVSLRERLKAQLECPWIGELQSITSRGKVCNEARPALRPHPAPASGLTWPVCARGTKPPANPGLPSPHCHRGSFPPLLCQAGLIACL